MILGINDGHDAGVAVIAADGEILFAANEERYTGYKQQWGFPAQALEHAFSFLKLDPAAVTDVAFGFRALNQTELSSLLEGDRVGMSRRAYSHAAAVAGPLLELPAVARAIEWSGYALRRNRKEIAAGLAKLGLRVRPVFLRHHFAHAASAYYTSGFDRACVVTLDAGGDGVAGTLWHGVDGRLRQVAELPRIHSLGDFWLAVTYLCGFVPDRHGGKITGLAAYLPCPEALAALETLYAAVPGRFLVRNRRYLFWKRLVARMRQVLAPFNREEIAWAAQRLLEKLVVHLVGVGLERTGERRLAVAGGIFANVRVNLELLRLAGVEELFVHPHMGDGGNGLGAALAVAGERHGCRPRRLEHVFLGDEAGGVAGIEGFRQALASETDLAAETARLLAEGKVVGVVQGRMEYGPRALLHRSILYHPFDPAVMEWLNARLDRTEFMPFAPVMPEEKGEEWFELAARGTLPSRFMTVCLPARERAKQKAPAIVHVDGTARPQLVRPSTDPFVCRVLAAFERLTGVPILINTSFNRHEHPILRTAEQGVEELRRGVVDVLVLEDRMLWRAPA